MADNSEVGLSDSQSESQVNADSGIQTEVTSINEYNVEASVLSSPGAISTPVTSKATELSVDDLFNFMRTMRCV